MKLQVTLVKSPISSKPNHIRIVEALGLHKVHATKVFEDTPSIRGMLFKVKHLGDYPLTLDTKDDLRFQLRGDE